MWYGSTRDDIRLVHLDIEITSKCTLKCKHCANLMQYYPEELQRHEDTDAVVAGIDALMAAVSWIDEVYVLGGEPFLHPALDEIVTAIAQYKRKIGYLCVASNGVATADKKAVAALRAAQIPVHITEYPRFAQQQAEACRSLRAQGAIAELHTRQWTLSTQCTVGTPDTFYRACRHALSPCVTLRGAKLWYCEFAANAYALGCESDCIDLSAPVDKSRIYEYLDPPEPFAACEFCSGFSGVTVDPAAEQCESPLRWQP